MLTRHHYVHLLGQWEIMLHCNVVSHWLSKYTKWFLVSFTHYFFRVILPSLGSSLLWLGIRPNTWHGSCVPGISANFAHTLQGCFVGTGAIIWLPQCQQSDPDEYGSIHHMTTLWIDGINITKQNIRIHLHIWWDVFHVFLLSLNYQLFVTPKVLMMLIISD